MLSIVKPSQMSVSYRTDPVRGGGLSTISAFLHFDFDKPDHLLCGEALAPMTARQMPAGANFDRGMLKPVGEVIIAGRALAPGGNAVRTLPVTARFGRLNKHLMVFGERRWQYHGQGYCISRPLPFDSMPIDITRAFGGPGHVDNPGGRGFRARRALAVGDEAPLPNVEYADRLITSVDDAPPPAHFGPSFCNNTQSMRSATFLDRYRQKHDLPFKARLSDPAADCNAPPDQRLKMYLTGGERFSICGMSRSGAPVGGRLPSFAVRGFAHRPQEDCFLDIEMMCDTVTLFPNEEKAVMTFRGFTRSRDRFGDDIGAIMLAVERADAPRTHDHYIDVFKRHVDHGRACEPALTDLLLMPRSAGGVGTVRQAMSWAERMKTKIGLKANRPRIEESRLSRPAWRTMLVQMGSRAWHSNGIANEIGPGKSGHIMMGLRPFGSIWPKRAVEPTERPRWDCGRQKGKYLEFD